MKSPREASAGAGQRRSMAGGEGRNAWTGPLGLTIAQRGLDLSPRAAPVVDKNRVLSEDRPLFEKAH